MSDTVAETTGRRVDEQRPLGTTELTVSALSLGTAPLGNLFTEVADDEATATVRRAVELGLSYVDTAPFYGHGVAERRTGAALAGLPPGRVRLSTKVGRLIRPASGADTGDFAVAGDTMPVFDFTADGVRRSLEESLQRLGLDRVDIVYIHDPDDHVEQALTEAYPALHELRSEGVVSAIGVGMNGPQIPARFVRETDIDCVLLAGRYTLLDQSGLTELLPLCVERAVSVVVGGVFNSGILADPRPGARFDYRPAAPEVLDRARRLDAVCRRHGVPLTAAALQFPLRHPAVASVLTGVRSVAELEANAAALATPVPADLWAELIADGLLPA